MWIRGVLRVGALALLLASCGDDGGGPADGALDGAPDGAPDAAPTDASMGDGDAPAALGPRVVASQPADGATDVWARQQVVLDFDLPVAPASVEGGAVDVTAAGESLLESIAVSADGLRVTIDVRPPTSLPASPVATVTADVRGTDGAPAVGATVSWSLPVWHRPADAALSTAAAGARVAWVDGAAWVLVLGDSPLVHRVDAAGATEVGPVPSTAGVEVRDAALLSAGGVAFVVWSEGAPGAQTVRAAAWDGAAFVAQASALASSADGFSAVLVDSVVRVATRTGAELSIVALDATSATAVADPLALVGDEVGAPFALAAGAAAATVVVGRDAGLHAARFEGSWSALASPPASTTALTAEADGAAADATGALEVVWRSARHAHGSVLGGADFGVVGRAMNIEPRAHVSSVAFVLGGAAPLFWWTEDGRGVVARRSAGRYRAFGDQVPLLDGTDLSVAVDDLGDPVRAYVDVGGAAWLERYNGAPELARGLSAYSPSTTCTLPADDDPTFPTTLTETGCYADVPAGVLAPGVIPYAINSVLWSDGATKRRFVSIPDGGALGYTETGALEAPIGTILIKEFFLQGAAGPFPVETRFMVKRCEDGGCAEPWQGYSYRWAEDGTEATLLDLEDGVVLGAWTTTTGSQDHIYPGRRVCARCHGQTPGWVLGLQASQLNRNIDYGDVVDDQLLALREAGLLEGAPASLDGLFAMPAPPDPSFDHADRTRAYLHANCAHCHRAGALGTVTDFRFEAPLEAGGNICSRLVPGDSAASWLYVKDSVRAPDRPDPFVGNPMPPLATNLLDTEQLAITAAWIDGMTSCP